MPVDTLANCKVTIGFGVQVTKNVANSVGQPIDSSLTISDTASFALGTASILSCDTIISMLNPPSGSKIANSGNVNVDLSGVLTDILNQTAVVLARVKAIMVELLTSDTGKSQISTFDATNGTTCSSITLGNGANPWIAPFGGTGVYTINNGGIWVHVDPTANGLPITAGTGDILKVLNNDGSNQASFRLTVFGSSA